MPSEGEGQERESLGEVAALDAPTLLLLLLLQELPLLLSQPASPSCEKILDAPEEEAELQLLLLRERLPMLPDAEVRGCCSQRVEELLLPLLLSGEADELED